LNAIALASLTDSTRRPLQTSGSAGDRDSAACASWCGALDMRAEECGALELRAEEGVEEAMVKTTKATRRRSFCLFAVEILL
jgi:hypothetical protein